MQRHWLNWSRPCLEQAAEHLLRDGRQGAGGDVGDDECDLSHWWLVLPGRRAAQLLLDALLDVCERESLVLIPPRTLTPGALVDAVLDEAILDADPPDATTPDEMGAGGLPRAEPSECVYAWATALAGLDPSTREAIVAAPPDRGDWPAWLAIGRTLESVRSDLAGADRAFEDVLGTAERMELFAESDRWRALIAAREAYRRVLADAGLSDPHDHRREAVLRFNPEAIEGGRWRVGLVGVVELNRLQRRLLERIGERGAAFIHAPADLADAFDELGCVDESRWSMPLNIPDERITLADRPADQARAVIDAIDEWSSRYAAGQMAVGLGDETLTPHLRTAGQWVGLDFRPASGVPIRRSAPYRLLDGASAWLADRRFQSFASLLRHADIETAATERLRDLDCADPYARPRRARGHAGNGAASPVEGSAAESRSGAASGKGDGEFATAGLFESPASTDDGGGTSRAEDEDEAAGPAVADWLGLLDAYFNRHLHRDASGDWLGGPAERHAMRAVHDAVRELFTPMLRPDGASTGASSARALGEWMEPMLRALGAVYEGRLSGTGESAAVTREACRAIRDVAGALSRIAPTLQPRVDGPTAIRLVLDELASRAAALPRDVGQIEMLGWLELHLDPSPVLIITNVNDGAIPGAVTADPFLPDSLRRSLGLLCNARRYARDAYLLRAIIESRDDVRLVVGRRTAQGDPLPPSRLLLSVDTDQLARRVQWLTDEDRAQRSDLPRGLPERAAASRFVIPAVDDEPPEKASMRVTEFRDYLRCPYRYWLRHIVGIEAVDDGAVELDALQFGTLVHEVLESFGDDEAIRDSVDVEAIEQYLGERLDEAAHQRFGKHPPPAVRVQLVRLRARLSGFARAQAVHRRDGWRIVETEMPLPEGVVLDVPGEEPMPIRGTIDRIDYHEGDDAWLILDYKTSERPKTLEEAYWGRRTYREGEWCDLQLPLYRMLAGQLPRFDGVIRVGHFVLPSHEPSIGIQRADHWDGAWFDDAIEVARDVVRGIRGGHFPMRDDGGRADGFERICQVHDIAAGESVGDGDGEP